MEVKISSMLLNNLHKNIYVDGDSSYKQAVQAFMPQYQLNI